MRRVEHDDDETPPLVSLNREVERAGFAKVHVRRGRNPWRKLLVCVRVLHSTSERQELDIFELNVLECLVFAFAWIELRNDAVFNISRVVDDEDVPHANILGVERRLAQVADDLHEILIALEAL